MKNTIITIKRAKVLAYELGWNSSLTAQSFLDTIATDNAMKTLQDEFGDLSDEFAKGEIEGGSTPYEFCGYTTQIELSRVDVEEVKQECKEYGIEILNVRETSNYPMYRIHGTEMNLRRWYQEWYWEGDSEGQISFEEMFNVK